MTTRRCTAVLCFLLLVLSFPAAYAQEEGGAAEGGQEGTTEGGEGGEGTEGVPPEETQPAPSDDALKPKAADTAPTAPVLTTGKRPESSATWKDIVVVPRKSFLKRKRVELMPFFATTMNDTLIQHFALGGEINFFLTDILSIGVLGMYYFKNILDQEFYTRYHFNRVPSLNKYIYTVALNFAYVPIYGKFAVFNSHIMHFEIFATAGVGLSGTEIIPRDYRYDPFKNMTTLTFPVGMGGRLFLTKWLAVQTAFRSYIMLDKFEPPNRGGAEGEAEVELAKSNAKTDIVNNMMFDIGFCFFLPVDFTYTTFR